MDSLRNAIGRSIELVQQMQDVLDHLQVAGAPSDHRADWREYIQEREHFADIPVPVVPLMEARPGATEPGLFPTHIAEHAEAEAQVAEHLRLARDAARKQSARVLTDEQRRERSRKAIAKRIEFRERIHREWLAANTKDMGFEEYRNTVQSAAK